MKNCHEKTKGKRQIICTLLVMLLCGALVGLCDYGLNYYRRDMAEVESRIVEQQQVFDAMSTAMRDQYQSLQEDYTELSDELKDATGTIDAIRDKLSELSDKPFITAEDVEALMAVVELEARGEGLYGKQLVAGVILNRVLDDRWPDTVIETVEQRGQFSVVNGKRYLKARISDETVEAVNLVLSGENVSEGALFFRTKSGASRWKGKRGYLYSYGNHAFFV